MRGSILIALILFVSVSLYAKPRVSLVHFEKDLQNMAKKSNNVAIKAGSFVDFLAEKRRKKEAVEQAIATLQHEVDALTKEVAQYEVAEREAALLVEAQKTSLQQRTQDLQAVVAQLAQAHDVLALSQNRSCSSIHLATLGTQDAPAGNGQGDSEVLEAAKNYIEPCG